MIVVWIQECVFGQSFRPCCLRCLGRRFGCRGREVCEELSLTVRGSSFEDPKRKMEAALQAHIESILRKHSRKSEQRLPDENQKPTLQFAFGLETPDSQQIQRDILVILVFTYPFFQRRRTRVFSR